MSPGGPDAVVVGSGPNGLAAAITLARAGRSVTVYEAASTVGGGCRSAELTLPGLVHDICSAIHPLAAGSPFLASLPLSDFGAQLIHPVYPFAHPLDSGSVVMHRSFEETAAGLDADGPAYRSMMGWMVKRAPGLIAEVLSPLRVPKRPLLMGRFGLKAIRSADRLARSTFKYEQGRALMAGLAAHSMLPLTASPTAGYGLFLGLLAHAAGWPVIGGGSQKLADAMASYLKSLGGSIVTGSRIDKLEDLPESRAYLFDVNPSQLARIADGQLPPAYAGKLRSYRYGPGVFKLDWALSSPIPWASADCREAGTVHVGGRLDEIAASEGLVNSGSHPEQPYVIVAQQSLFDPGRSAGGKHTAWGYCHVPGGSIVDMTGPIEAQIERFAPGFKDCVLARSAMGPADFERHNANYVGGDINGGSARLSQLFARPAARWDPYSTPNNKIYICSSSTPPGGGVHGMCGYFAAKSALKKALGDG